MLSDRRGAMQLPSDVWLQKQQRYIPIPKTLGAGSYGKVLQAVDAITQEQVALKKQKLPSESAAQELLAYRGLASFPSLHVQTLHDFFVVPPPSGSSGLSVLYLVYRVAETDLWCLFWSPDVQAGALPKSRFIALVAGACAGLSHLHGLHIIHGDPSLKNFLVASGDRTIIADLGAAHSAHGHFLSGRHITTVYVRPPEHHVTQAKLAGTPAADCWALGVIAMALSTGRIPFLIEDEAADHDVAKAQLRLLGSITEDTWPGHQQLEGWSTFADTHRQDCILVNATRSPPALCLRCCV